jgi:hypothetical protein
MSFNSPFTGQVIQPTDVSYRYISQVTLGPPPGPYQLEWPINGSPTDNAAARIMEVAPLESGNQIQMPPANQASVGLDALFRNLGSSAFTVLDYDGNLIVTISPGQARYIYITDNADEAGIWGTIAFGSGSSSVDAATLAGYGLKAITTTLNQSHPVTSFSSDYTAVATDRALSYLWTGGAGTLTLTAPTTLANDWFMMVRNGGTGTLTVSPAAGLINGASSIAMQPADSAFIVCSGTTFFTVGLGKTTQFNFTQLTKAVTTGTYTLTSAEAANVVQKYTGTLSGNVTIVLPPTIQVYYITNQTDGTGAGYTITFTTGVSGAGTATVPAGSQAILVCDSVNMLNAASVAAGITSLALGNGTVSTPSLNFSAETNTGVYRPASNQFGITVAGTQRFRATSAGIVVTGTGTFSGGVSGGTFP